MKKGIIVILVIVALVAVCALYGYSLKSAPRSVNTVNVSDIKKNTNNAKTLVPTGQMEENLCYLTAKYAAEPLYDVNSNNVEVIKISHKKFDPRTRINSSTGFEDVVLPVRVFATVKIPLGEHGVIAELDVNANFYLNGVGDFVYDVVNTKIIKEEKY